MRRVASNVVSSLSQQDHVSSSLSVASTSKAVANAALESPQKVREVDSINEADMGCTIDSTHQALEDASEGQRISDMQLPIAPDSAANLLDRIQNLALQKRKQFECSYLHIFGSDALWYKSIPAIVPQNFAYLVQKRQVTSVNRIMPKNFKSSRRESTSSMFLISWMFWKD